MSNHGSDFTEHELAGVEAGRQRLCASAFRPSLDFLDQGGSQ